jgi:hypothetical protein
MIAAAIASARPTGEPFWSQSGRNTSTAGNSAVTKDPVIINNGMQQHPIHDLLAHGMQ